MRIARTYRGATLRQDMLADRTYCQANAVNMLGRPAGDGDDMADDDLRYEPPASGLEWLHRLRPATCLVMGEVPEDERDAVMRIASDVRTAAMSGMVRRFLHQGTYAFDERGVWHVVLAADGQEPRPADRGQSWRLEDGDHLGLAQVVHGDSWGGATPYAGKPGFAPGAVVRPKGTNSFGRISRVIAVAGGYEFEVDIQGTPSSYSEDALVPAAGDPRDPAFWLQQVPVNAGDISLTLTWTKLHHPLTDVLYSFASSKTVFRPYQFKPVLKMLTGSSGRILIADEVGLGKTIEAGLIWSELEQRSKLDRVLVVTPAALVLKWKTEMERRFDRTLPILKPRELADLLEPMRNGTEPEIRGIMSIESLRTSKVLEDIQELHPRFDLVIVDEAHYLRNRESKTHALGELLADNADYLVFLSATPLNLGNDDLFNLMSLLDADHFGDRAVFDAQLRPNEVLNRIARSLLQDGRNTPRKLAAELDRLGGLEFGASITDRPDFAILRRLFDVERPLRPDEIARARRLLSDLNVLGGVLTRTRKAEVPDAKAVREPRNIDVEWTQAEHDYYMAVYAWCMARALKSGSPPGFVMQMPLRQAASCIPASRLLIQQRDPLLFQQEYDDFGDFGEDSTSEPPAEMPGAAILSRPIPVDTKYERLQEELLRIRQTGLSQMMIFSFFRRTLAYLAERLSRHFTVRVMDGGVPLPEREQIMRDFRDHRFEILLVSEVGSEGLDFEFCNVLVNYDLPWNPMRVEQRIGRLDRFGQHHEKIFIYNMCVPGTIETDIFQRLYDRIGVFENSIGELEPILRDQIGDISKRVLDPKLDAAGRQHEMDRIVVAVEQRRHDTDDLRNSQAYLSGLDDLLVEGMTADGPGGGRFVGPAEICRVIDELLQRVGGHRGPVDADGIFRIVGSPKLATQLRKTRSTDDGSRHSRSKLAALMQDGTPLECTFKPEVASRRNLELLSARHPLVRVAVEVLNAETLALPRFGSVCLQGLPVGSRYLISLDLAVTTGLRPLCELWATAVDVGTGLVSAGVGDTLLQALAEGELRDGPTAAPGDMQHLLGLAKRELSARRSTTERLRAQENAALVEGRIRAREGSLDLQIRKTAELLARLRQDGRGKSVVRMSEGRLRRLSADRRAARDDLIGRKELSLSLTSVAVVIATAAEPSPC
ncbi:helicase-related protein [Dactylosporangium sp. NPDC005555]|uniref:DEAD/DEAH box helicase n=1 Tax=Dactylosporangium sp. NPDC005555 TaxID=3154889 RepID=UPI0033B0CB9E